jgi:hypothetical protein
LAVRAEGLGQGHLLAHGFVIAWGGHVRLAAGDGRQLGVEGFEDGLVGVLAGEPVVCFFEPVVGVGEVTGVDDELCSGEFLFGQLHS